MKILCENDLPYEQIYVFYNLMRRCNPEFAPFEDSADFIHQTSNHNIWRFLEINNKIVGMVMIRGWEEEWREKVLGVYVAPGVRRQGLGTLLCLTGIQEAREKGLGKLRLHVNPANWRAITLYRNLGFVVSPEMHNNELIMRKSLWVSGSAPHSTL